MDDERLLDVTGAGGVRLSARQTGPATGRPVVLMHGLTMTRDHVLMGSSVLERAGYRVIAYDTRGHGASTTPTHRDGYGYDLLAADLVAVMDAFEASRAVLVGSSLGCHTAVVLALQQPERVAGLVAITPAFDPEQSNEHHVGEAHALAEALRRGGVEEFLDTDTISSTTGRALVRRRMAAHGDLHAVADSMEAAWAARPFESFAELGAIEIPALVVGTRDEFDPRHGYDLARKYAAALPHSEFACEDPGRAPLAWSRRRIGPLVLELANRAAWGPSARDRGARPVEVLG